MPTNVRDERQEESTCPTCDRDFASARGVRVHHTRVHGERLPNRQCADCETPFAPYAERVRCDDCVGTLDDADGRPRTDQGDTTGTCLVCDAEFRYYASEKNGRYCPACVADPDVACTVHVQSSDRVSVACSHCGEEVDVFRSEADAQSDHFCDRACYRAWLSVTQRDSAKWCADDNPNWRGGVDADDLYGAGWPSARRRALERDDRECQRCGVGKEELGQNPDVHHRTPVREFGDPREAHTLDNLVCLCRPCHLAVERGEARVEDGE
ncbi:HNH endonuclease [Halospeciosus flavus]|uniref:HNH endonuclease n=1 Tax=Halospeciosus flavus TaxID=3032283 RepID=UPI003609EB37